MTCQHCSSPQEGMPKKKEKSRKQKRRKKFHKRVCEVCGGGAADGELSSPCRHHSSWSESPWEDDDIEGQNDFFPSTSFISSLSSSSSPSSSDSDPDDCILDFLRLSGVGDLQATDFANGDAAFDFDLEEEEDLRFVLDEELLLRSSNAREVDMRKLLREHLMTEGIEVIVLLEGVDPVTSSSLQSRQSYSYPHGDFLFDHTFVGCTREDPETGGALVDYTKIHDTRPCGPEDEQDGFLLPSLL